MIKLRPLVELQISNQKEFRRFVRKELAKSKDIQFDATKIKKHIKTKLLELITFGFTLADEQSIETNELSIGRNKIINSSLDSLTNKIIIISQQHPTDTVNEAIIQAAYPMNRLVITETYTAFNRKFANNHKNLDGHYVWQAALDQRTCEQCENLNGKRFKQGELDMPPLHPNCRCIADFILH